MDPDGYQRLPVRPPALGTDKNPAVSESGFARGIFGILFRKTNTVN